MIYQNLETQKQIICLEKMKNSPKVVMDEIDSLKKKIFNKKENLINPLDYSLEIHKSWCAT